MNTMFQVNEFFIRMREKAGRVKLTVWNNQGTKLLSELVSLGSLDTVWEQIAKESSAEVVQKVKEAMQGS